MNYLGRVLSRDLAARRSQWADGVAPVAPFWVAAAVVGAFAALVGLGASHHEMWRDEVRALSIATHGSFGDIFPALKNEGHPALWYVLLFGVSRLLGGSRLALPLASAVVATASTWLVIRHAPFALWQRTLFVFGLFPAYVYAVMSRNYGITMVLLFAYCALGRSRRTRPILAGSILALMANTNVHSMVLVGALVAGWVVAEMFPHHPDWRGPSRSGAIVGVSIALAGCVICVLQVWPESVSTVHGGVMSTESVMSQAGAMVNPGIQFKNAFGYESLPDGLSDVTKFRLSWVPADATFAAVALILSGSMSLMTAHLVALAGLTVLFSTVYPGYTRHQGLEYLFVVALLWMWMEEGPRTPTRLRATSVLLTALFALNVMGAARAYRKDFRFAESGAPALATWLKQNPAYKDAILIAEPDFVMETMPYYSANRLYWVRENRFAKWTTFTSANKKALTLTELLLAMERLQMREKTPVLLLFSYSSRLDIGSAIMPIPYGRELTWDAAQRETFLAHTRRVAAITDVQGDERYVVFALNGDSTKAPVRAP